MFRMIHAACVLLMAIAIVAQARAQSPARPNILVIVVDDFGYGDLSIHGCKDIPTPNMDALAVGGVRCTQGYISAPQCSPTRAGLLTGRYQQRFGHEFNSAPLDSGLSLKETTLADRLKGAGYKTGLVGKWHLGSDEQHHPQSRGFDEFYGFLGGANPYLPQGPKAIVPRIMRGREPIEEKQFLTEAFAREATAFIDRHQKEPFFLYLAFNATHGPMQATEKYLAKFASIQDENRRTYAAMTAALDDAVGAVLAKVKSSGLEQNTLVFFHSDNGGPTDVNASRNDPYRGLKGEVREGGIRTPFFVKWPANLRAGTTYDQPVIQLDIHPTALAAAGVSLPPDAKPLDGLNLLPYLTGQNSAAPHETLYWRFNFPPQRPERHKWAIRKGDWKLFTDVGGNRDKGDEATAHAGIRLVNLATDVREEKDLSQQHPEKAKELKALWDKWNSQLMAPGGENPTPPKDAEAKAAKKAKRSDKRKAK
jgi:arylsulfatase A-like enzyme